MHKSWTKEIDSFHFHNNRTVLHLDPAGSGLIKIKLAEANLILVCSRPFGPGCTKIWASPKSWMDQLGFAELMFRSLASPANGLPEI